MSWDWITWPFGPLADGFWLARAAGWGVVAGAATLTAVVGAALARRSRP